MAKIAIMRNRAISVVNQRGPYRVVVGGQGPVGAQGAIAGGIRLAVDTTTSDSDPTAGNWRANSTTFASITKLWIDNAQVGGADITAWLDALDDGGASTHRCIVHFENTGDSTQWAEFNVTGSVVDKTGYRELTVTPRAQAGWPFANAASTILTQSRTGATGTGDFSGPSSSTDSNLVGFNGTGGKTGKDSGIAASNVAVKNADNSFVAQTFTGSQSTFVRSGGQHVFATKRTDNHGTSAAIIQFAHYGMDATPTQQAYASWDVLCDANTVGAASGTYRFQTVRAGASSNRLYIGGGVYHPSASGGDKGDNTINFGAVYDDNSLLTCPALAEEFFATGAVNTDKWDAMVPDRVEPETIERVPVLEAVQGEILVPEADGSYVRKIVTVEQQVVDFVPVYDEQGNGIDAIEEPAYETVTRPGRIEPRIHATAHLFKAMVDDGFDPRDPAQYIAKLKVDQALPGMPTQADWQHNSLSGGELHSRLWLATEMLALVVISHEDRIAKLERV